MSQFSRLIPLVVMLAMQVLVWHRPKGANSHATSVAPKGNLILRKEIYASFVVIHQFQQYAVAFRCQRATG